MNQRCKHGWLGGEQCEDCKQIKWLEAERDALKADAARYRWLAEYLPGDSTTYDDAIVSCNSAAEIGAVIDKAMEKQND